MNQEIEFVYFDLGNILLNFDPVVSYTNMAKLFDVDPIEGRKALYDSGVESQFEHGALSPQDFADEIRRSFDRQEAEISNESLFESISNMFTPIESMNGVLQAVRDRGRKVGLLSNTCFAHWNWILAQRFDVFNFEFDELILSFQVGSMKPQRRIYEVAQHAAATPVENILFIDDRHENVDAALAFGWNAKQCFGGQQAIDVLRNHDVMDDEY